MGADVVWVAGLRDAESLAKRHPQARIVNVPNGVGALPDLSDQPVTSSRLFAYGSWTYPPNAAGLRALAAAPTSTSCMLTVFGDVPKSLQADVENSAQATQPHIAWRFAGYEPDWQRMAGTGDVAIIPLWAGGGTKLRAVQLAAMGAPMVVTAEALSGLPPWFAVDTVVASSALDLIELAAAYVDFPAARRRLQKRVQAELSWSAILCGVLAETGVS